jgi:hypothetical protein
VNEALRRESAVHTAFPRPATRDNFALAPNHDRIE